MIHILPFQPATVLDIARRVRFSHLKDKTKYAHDSFTEAKRFKTGEGSDARSCGSSNTPEGGADPTTSYNNINHVINTATITTTLLESADMDSRAVVSEKQPCILPQSNMDSFVCTDDWLDFEHIETQHVSAEFLESSSCGPVRAGTAPNRLRPPPGETHAPARFDLLTVQLDEFDDGCYECEVVEGDHMQLLPNPIPTPPLELPSSSSSAPIYLNSAPAAKRAKLCLDDSDDEPFHSRIETDEAQTDVIDEIPDVPEAFSSRPKRRLSKKTAPHDTNFSNTPLANRTDYKIKMVEQKLEKRKFKASQVIAKRCAITMLANQLPQISTVEGNNLFLAISPEERPHTSHEIHHLLNNEDIIFCKCCSAWSARLKLKSLLKPCEGLKDGNRSRLKLLNAGVPPYPGARMPITHSRALTGRGSYRRQ